MVFSGFAFERTSPYTTGAALPPSRRISAGMPHLSSMLRTRWAHFSIPSPVAETLGCLTSSCRPKTIPSISESIRESTRF